METTPDRHPGCAPLDPMRPAPHLVRRVRPETHDIFTLELTPVDGGQAASFSPGQFNMLYVFGVGEAAISISGDPVRTGPLVHTVRAVGTVTSAMSKLKRGDVLGVRGPFGNPWPVARAAGKDLVIVAGGVGLAPLRSAMYYVLARRNEFRRVVLLYGARTPRDVLYRRELDGWGRRSDVNVGLTLDTATMAWRGNVGVVTTLVGRAAFDPLDSVALICGPEVMMRFTIAELRKRGMSAEQIFVSMERNMKCGVGFCGHCQYGPAFVCRDGPVFRYDHIEWLFKLRQV